MKHPAIIITGASHRIGFAITRHCLSAGFAVVAHYHTNKGDLQSLAEHVSAGRLFFVKADISKNPELLFKSLKKLPVCIAGLVNNASVFNQGDISNKKHFDKTLQINTLAPLALMREYYKRICSGWIINLSDAGAGSLNRNFQNYRISKILLEELTRQAAFSFAPEVRVNAIAPGPTLPPAKGGADVFNTVVNKTPLRRAAHIACLLKSFDYLIDNCCVTGEILHVDSGLHLIDGR
jgi:NAD(P)-dependent dehydrogenase (short-subunit alcohol dehydrogenase family)